jgi:NAD(P)-dependent dehydrogenase (short-subunit alcohol dehydrogenase family)
LELGDRGIRVNAVAPGVVRTPLTERYFQDPNYAQTIRDIHALGRWAEPDEIAPRSCSWPTRRTVSSPARC